MATIGALIYRIGADTAQLVNDVGKVQTQLGRLDSFASKARNALIGLVSIGGITAAVRGYAEFTGQLTDLSAQTGISTMALQKLKYAAEQNGGTLDQVAGAVTKLGDRLVSGDKSAVRALGTLGLSLDSIRQMSPDQIFATVGDALAKVENPLERSKLAIDLFGKSGAEILPMLTGHLRSTADEAERLGLVMSEEMVAAGDEFGDTLDRLKLSGSVMIAQILTPMVPALTAVASAVGSLAGTWLPKLQVGWTYLISLGMSLIARLYEVAAAAADLAVKVGGPVAKAMGINSALATGLRASGQWWRDAATAQALAASQMDQVPKKVETLTRGFRNLGEGADEAGKKTAAFAAKLVENLDLDTREWSKALDDPLRKIATAGQALVQIMAVLEGATRAWSEDLDRPQQLFMARQPTAPVGATVREGAGSGLLAGLSPALAHLPQTILAALTGGGSIGKSAGALIGSEITEGLGTKAGDWASKIAGWLGKGLSSVIPGIGGLLGSLVGGLFGKLFGPSKGLLEGRKADAEIKQLQTNLLATYGSLEDIARIGGVAGQNLVGLWGSKNVQGLADFKRGLDAFNSSLEKQKQITDELAALQGTRAADGLASWESMTTAAERYGISLDALGGRYQQMKANASFADLLSDYQLLTDSGADVNSVLAGMSDEISTLVASSVKFGTEIPENMRPLLEQLAASGLLLDENGNKIEDLAGLKFGEPIETEWDKVSNAIKDLTKVLDDLRGALKDFRGEAAEPVRIGVRYDVNSLPSPRWDTGEGTSESTAAFGGLVTSRGIQHLAGGGKLLRFRPRGTDIVPAMLSAGEFVVSRPAAERVGYPVLRAINRGAGVGSGSQTIVVELDGRPILKRVLRDAPSYLRLVGAA